MKKGLIFLGALIALSVAAVGCTNENLLQELNDSPGHEVGVNAYVSPATRGLALENKTELQGMYGIELFAVFSKNRAMTEMFMGSKSKGVEFIYQFSENKWDYVNEGEKRYWEQVGEKNVEFFAFSPMMREYPEGSVSFDFNYNNTCFRHEVSTDVAEQRDVLYAKCSYGPNDVASRLGGIKLHFQHLASQIVFSGKIRDDSKTVIQSVKVNSIRISPIKSAFSYALQHGEPTVNAGSDPEKEFEVAFTPVFSIDKKIKNTDGVVELSNSRCALLLPPQSVGNSTIEVNAVMTFADGSDLDIVYTHKLVGERWSSGKKYIYTLVFSTDKISPIEVSPDVMPWEEVDEAEIELKG